jgi:hypothetical protein
MEFRNTTDRIGIVDLLEDLTDSQSTEISNYTIEVKTRDINMAFDDYQNFVKSVAGTWQADDTSHTKYPNVKFNLVSGQQDYSFTVDEQGNQVQDIYRVEMKKADGTWTVLSYINEMDEDTALSTIEASSGTPTEWFISANGIFLKNPPNYSSTLGLRMFYTRSPSYFVDTDDTKTPGIPNGHHKYLAWKPAYWYWLPKDTQRAQAYLNEVLRLEDSIKNEYSQRIRAQKNRMSVRQESNK